MPFDPAAINAVVFDMDGLLIDSEKIYLKSAMEAADLLGLDLSVELYNSVVGLTTEQGEMVLRKGMGPDFSFEHFDVEMRKILNAEFDRHVPLKPGVVELLSLLDEQKIPKAVATSASRSSAEKHLTHSGVISYFQAIVTSNDVTQGKPNPEPYLLAAQKLDTLPENCLALEDSHNGVRSANGAGMQTIMIPDMLSPTEEIRALTIGVLDNLHAIKDRFQIL